MTPPPAQLCAIYTGQAFETFDVIHYKYEGQFAAVALGYIRDGAGWEALLRGKGRENVIEALEALWSHTQKQLIEKFKEEPLKS